MNRITIETRDFKEETNITEDEMTQVIALIHGSMERKMQRFKNFIDRTAHVAIQPTEEPEEKEKKEHKVKKRVKKPRLKKEKLKLPSKTELIDYIKAQPNMEHSVDSISNHFLSKIISYSGEGKTNYVALWTAIKRAREGIAKTEKGKWIETRVGEGAFKKKSYKFEKAEIKPAIEPVAPPTEPEPTTTQ